MIQTIRNNDFDFPSFYKAIYTNVILFLPSNRNSRRFFAESTEKSTQLSLGQLKSKNQISESERQTFFRDSTLISQETMMNKRLNFTTKIRMHVNTIHFQSMI